MSDLSGLPPSSLPVLPAGVSFTPLEDLIPTGVTASPFIGLRPFDIEDAPLFFGRSEQVDELLQRLRRTRFVAVVGSSGCGKSSLVRAGLIHALRAGFLVADRDVWDVRTMKPGDRPLRNLAAALLERNAELTALDELTDRIRRFRYRAVLERFQPSLARNENVLLIVDQFEETFRFGLKGECESRDEAEDFISILLALAQKPRLPIYVGLTMRSDFMGDCDAFPGLAEAMNRSVYLVPRLTREQRREAIEGPIRMAGAEISPHLTDQLLNESDTAADQLPVLQHALMRTWEEWRKDEDALGVEPTPEGNSRRVRRPVIDTDHYKRAGTLKNALHDHAERALQGLNRDLTRKIFQVLTDVDAFNRQVRRPARLSELVAVTGGSRKSILKILKRFQSDGRCFVNWGPEGDPDPFVDLSHESLIRRWKTLDRWVEEEAESAATYRELEESTARHLRGEEGLWDDPELPKALEWQKQNQVNTAWAARVRPSELFRAKSWKRPAFDEVLGFLGKSKTTREEALARKAAQEEELLLARERQVQLAQAQELARVREEKLLQTEELMRAGQEKLAQTQELVRVREEKLAQERELVRVQDDALVQAQELARAREEKLAQRQKWNRKLKIFAAVVFVLAVAALGFAMFARAKKSTLENVLLASHLVRQSRELAATNPQRSLLLAAEAFALELRSEETRKAKDAENALRFALAGAGGRGLGAHARDISSLGSDGNWLISGARDGSVQAWDLSKDPSQPRWIIERSGRKEGSEEVYVAVAKGWIATGGADGSIRIQRGLQPAKVVKSGGPEISALAIDPDGRWLAAGDSGGDLQVWQIAGGALRTLRLDRNPHRSREPRTPEARARRIVLAKISRRGLVTVDVQGRMVFWRLGGSVVPTDEREQVSAADLTDDWLAFGEESGMVRLLRLAPGRPEVAWEAGPGGSEHSPEAGRAPVRTIAVGARSGSVFTASVDGKMALWNGPVAQTLFTDRNQISELKVSPDDRWLVAAYSDGPVRLWRLGSINPILLQGHYGPVQNVTFSPDARWLFTGGSDGTVRRWDLGAPDPSNEEIQYHRRSRGTLVGVSRDLHWGVFVDLKKKAELCDLASSGRCEKLDVAELPEVRFSPDGRWLVTGNGGPPGQRWFHLRDLKNGSRERIDNVSAVDVGSCADGDWLASGRPNGSVLIERLGRGRVIEIPPSGKPQERVDRILVSPDRRFVAIAWDGGTFQVWRLLAEGRREKAKALEITYRISEMSFSPDSHWLVVADSGNAAYVWNLRDLGAEPREIRIERRITELAFGLANQLILGSENGAATAYLLGTETKEKRVFAGHRGEITSLTFDSGRRFLATGAVDGTVRVWDLEDGDVEPAVIPYPSRGAIVTTAFSQDGRSLQTVSLDGTIRRWDLSEEGLRQTARLMVGRNLSENEWCLSFAPSSLLPGVEYHATFGGLPLLWTKGSNCDFNKKRTGA